MQENKQEGLLENYCWCEAVEDYVLVYRGTDEKEGKRAQRSFLNRQTRARKKREKVISEIIREEKLYSYEDALAHLDNMVNGGKVADVLIRHMGTDEGHWKVEIMRAKKEREEKASAEGV